MKYLISRFVALLFVCLSMQTQAIVQSDFDYLPDNIEYNPDIPTPQSILGSPVGTWHVRHDQLVNYMRVLAQVSPRVSLIETGRTHENRPLVLLQISAEGNQSRLEQMRSEHMQRVQAGQKAKAGDPLVLWMGYSVHGNEPSGSNAALLVAYYLAAGQGEEIDALLKDNIVLLDPSINPDGLSRFAQWANMHRGQNLVADPAHREHREGWPNGRTNHYWFDLNRDWLLLTHPESRARITQFHQWRPHVLTDFHEMGTNSTYFFQPGVPSRTNPWTPQQNVTLTNALGDFHAQALDQEKQLYFTAEGFDDFYYGKGSTYPDAHGSIGILFEQASSRGHLQDSVNGPLSFSDTIQNQVTTSLSTFAGAVAKKQDLQAFQADFVDETQALVKDDDLFGYVLQERHDPTRFNRMLDILQRHQIAVYPLSADAKLDGQVYSAEHSVFVPLDQPQYRLIRSLFSTRKSFKDNTFYDVSNWNIALAFNIPYQAVEKSQRRKLSISEELAQPRQPEQRVVSPDNYALAFSWQDFNAPAMLQRLLSANVSIKLSGTDFTAKTSAGDVAFAAGAVLIPKGLAQPDNVDALVTKHARELGIEVHSITSGLTPVGNDLGGRKMLTKRPVSILLVGGEGTNPYEAGEVWHYLDTRVGVSPTIVELSRLGSLELANYSHIIFVSGSYNKVSDSVALGLGKWVKNGGVLIGQKSATRWFADNGWLKASFKDDSELDSAFDTSQLTFADREALRAKKLIAGATYMTDLDLTHPLAFGYTTEQLPLFKTSNLIMNHPDKPFITVARYLQAPLAAGYTAPELQALVADTAAIVAHRLGQGRVVAFADNLNFRGYWYGSSRLLSNAIFMSDFIQGQG